MASLRATFARLRYPMPELSDFADEMPLDKATVDDHDDNETTNKMPEEDVAPKPKPKGKKES